MPSYQVSVEKRLYCTGAVKVSAKDSDEAIEKVSGMINSGKLQTASVEWSDPEYEDLSFTTTGDVD
jgi:hypothetical protein